MTDAPAPPAAPSRASRSGLHHRLLARLCVAVTRPLARARPHRVRGVLCLLRIGAAPASARQAAAARELIVAVSRKCAAPHSCLHRSLATTVLCRARGVWPTWCTGVRTQPFGAHAWVAVAGEPVGEPAHEGDYAPILTVPPRGASS
jgi:hypothetical protein